MYLARLSQLITAGRARGVSLIEGVLYLVISLSVITGGVVLFQQLQGASRTQDAAQTIRMAANGLDEALRNEALDRTNANGVYQNITSYLLNAKFIPSGHETENDDVMTLGGDSRMIVTLSNAGTGKAATETGMIITNLAPETCTRILAKSGEQDALIGTYHILVFGESYDGVPAEDLDPRELIGRITAGQVFLGTQAISPADIADACQTYPIIYAARLLEDTSLIGG